MKDYLYYKQNNSEQYDPTTTNTTNITARETVLLKCISCKETYSNAYKCKDCSCPSYHNKTKWMKRPHSCSDWFRENRHLF